MYGAASKGEVTGPFAAVVVAVSFGALQALSELLSRLPDSFPVPVFIAQHAEADGLTPVLRRRCSMEVRTAAAFDVVGSCGVTVVPARVAANAGGDRFMPAAKVNRPADRLLVTMAELHAHGLIAVVLTGRLDDGAVGARATKRAGGRVVVQDPTTAVARGMPSAALATGCVDFVLPLERIAGSLVALTMAPGGADLLAVPAASWSAYA